MVIIAASDPFVFLYPRAILAEQTPGAVRCWSVLSAARSAHRLTRVAARDLVLESLDRPLLEGPFERLFRDRPLAIGESVLSCGARIRVATPSRLEVRGVLI